MRKVQFPGMSRTPPVGFMQRPGVATPRPRHLMLAVFTIFVGLPAAAHAYIDPGAGPLLWQMLVAAFVGVLFQARRIWSRLRSKKTDDQNDA